MWTVFPSFRGIAPVVSVPAAMARPETASIKSARRDVIDGVRISMSSKVEITQPSADHWL
jgi:hypothetical protein